jgi:uncharacterized protein (DUF697 family)
MDRDNIPFYLRQLTTSIENKIADSLKSRDKEDNDEDLAARHRNAMPPMRNEYMEFMEPDWDDIDRKANLIVARYTAISAAANVLPLGLDIVGVAASFTKMTTELSGVYQVIVSNKRARQMGWAIATTTGTVLGTVYAASRLVRFVPGGYFFGVLVQAPIVTAVAWAAGDTLKGYFKETRKGREPGIDALRDSFAKTLRIKLTRAKTVKGKGANAAAGTVTVTGTAAAATTAPATAERTSVSDTVDKIAGLHELLRAGAITQAEFDATKGELLKKM